MAGRQARPRNPQSTAKKVPDEDSERNFTVSTGLDKARARVVQYDRGISYKILLASYSSFFGIQISFIIRKVPPSHPLQVAFTLASATGVFALQLRNCSPSARRWPTWKRGVIVLGQGLATYLPLLAFHLAWTGMTGFLAGSLLLLISGWKAWAPFAAMATLMFVVAIMTWLGPSDIASMAIFCLASGIVVFGLAN